MSTILKTVLNSYYCVSNTLNDVKSAITATQEEKEAMEIIRQKRWIFHNKTMESQDGSVRATFFDDNTIELEFEFGWQHSRSKNLNSLLRLYFLDRRDNLLNARKFLRG